VFWVSLHSAFHDGGRTPFVFDGRQVAAEQVIQRLTDEERMTLVQNSRLRQTKYHSFAAVLAVTASRHARSAAPFPDGEVGVVATGGPTHTPVAWDFATATIRRGPRLINPMYFPHMLQSSVASSVAAECGAGAFAMTVGHDALAFHESLVAACELIEAGFARAVLLPITADGGARNSKIHRNAAMPGHLLDVGLCCLLSTLPSTPYANSLVLSECHHVEECDAVDAGYHHARWSAYSSGSISPGPQPSCPIPLNWLEGSEALTAAGGVVLIEAAVRIARDPDSSRGSFSLVSKNNTPGIASLFTIME